MQHTMNVEQMTSNDSPSKPFSPTFSFAIAVWHGIHMSTNTYIDPSNSDGTIPHNRMSELWSVATNAPFRSPIAEDFLPSSSSPHFAKVLPPQCRGKQSKLGDVYGQNIGKHDHEKR